MALNAAWHRAHPMPKNPSVEERIRWHEEHAKACACRPIPPTVLKEIRKRGTRAPTRGGPEG